MSLSNKLSITDCDLKGKRVLIRVSPAAGPDAMKTNANHNLNVNRSISTYLSTLTRTSPITSVLPELSQPSNMPSTTAPRPSS